MRHYDVMLRVAVTCAPHAPGDCDDTLRARACAAGADAVVLLDDTLDATRRTVNGSLVRFSP